MQKRNKLVPVKSLTFYLTCGTLHHARPPPLVTFPQDRERERIIAQVVSAWWGSPILLKCPGRSGWGEFHGLIMLWVNTKGECTFGLLMKVIPCREGVRIVGSKLQFWILALFFLCELGQCQGMCLWYKEGEREWGMVLLLAEWQIRRDTVVGVRQTILGGETIADELFLFQVLLPAFLMPLVATPLADVILGEGSDLGGGSHPASGFWMLQQP